MEPTPDINVADKIDYEAITKLLPPDVVVEARALSETLARLGQDEVNGFLASVRAGDYRQAFQRVHASKSWTELADAKRAAADAAVDVALKSYTAKKEALDFLAAIVNLGLLLLVRRVGIPTL